MREEIERKDGLLQLCSKVPGQRKIIERITDKLGVKHTLDTNTRVSRAAIDKDIEGWTTLLAEARLAFGIRAPRAKPTSSEKQTDFRKIVTGINVILRTWSDVELKDGTDGKPKRVGKTLLHSQYLVLVAREFSAMFVV